MDTLLGQDNNPEDTDAWIESLDAVLHDEGTERGRYLLSRKPA